MKLGIITFHSPDNYGAILQTYALQTYLETLGHNVNIIDYRPDYMISGGKLRVPLNKKDLRANLSVMFFAFVRLRSILSGRRRLSGFTAFRNKYINIDNTKYLSIKQLNDYPPQYDAYICGSDQIWNPPPRFGVDPAYYLDFGDETCRRISYAASFGKPIVDEIYESKIGELLRKLDAISVREESGVDLVKKISGCRAAWVPDPTLLLKDYDAVTAKPMEDDFVFMYRLRRSDIMSNVQKVVIQELDSRLIESYNPEQRYLPDGKVIQMGPSEWLGYIKYSRAVVTNSFHGTVFSILFKKVFIVVPIEGKNSSLNERMLSLLSRLGLQNRFLQSSDSSEIKRLLSMPIDWDDVHKRLNLWRDEALKYIKEALSV